MNTYTVVVMNLDKTAAIVAHAAAANPRAAYEQVLRDLYDQSEQDAEADPFNLAEAEGDRPLLCVFAGHLQDLSA